MKKILLVAALATCTSSVFAEPTTDLYVKGQLVMSACTPDLGGNNIGVVDFMSFEIDDLSDSSVNQLGSKNVTLNITCPVATKVSWHILDGKASSKANVSVSNGDATAATVSNAAQLFGVGTTNTDVKIGNYALFVNVGGVRNAGAQVDPIVMTNNSRSWSKTTTGGLIGDDSLDVAVAATGTTAPLAITSASFPLTVSLAVQDTATLNITDDVSFEGEATITLRYL